MYSSLLRLARYRQQVAYKIPPLRDSSHIYSINKSLPLSFHAVLYSNSKDAPGSKKDESKNIIDIEKEPPSRLRVFGNNAVMYLKIAAVHTIDLFRHPSQIPAKAATVWKMTKEVGKHYWIGTKLLYSEFKLASKIVGNILRGHGITRRERRQLVRTFTDLLRFVPISIFIIVPFMELLLPFAVKIFPNMLPSTYIDEYKKEENMKNVIQMRLAVAGFMQETLQSMAHKKKKGENKEEVASAKELIEFMEKAKLGEPLPNETVLRMARLFKDELTLANMPRPQLTTMCQFMNLPPYGTDSFLRFQLRAKINTIKEDDRRILWEGIDSLNVDELREACEERGMRATGLNVYGYKRQLREWLDLSMQKNVPLSLLIMSRAFVLNPRSPNMQINSEESLRDSLSSLDDDVINEVILENITTDEERTTEIIERKIESLHFQNEMIREEEKAKGVSAKIHDSHSVLEGSKESLVQLAPNNAVQLESTIKTLDDATPRLSDIQALADMAQKSSVEREKMLLALMKAKLEPPVIPQQKSDAIKDDANVQNQDVELNTKEYYSSSLGESQPKISSTIDDYEMVQLKRVLTNMFSSLESDINKTDKILGTKLQKLDKDQDGIISVQEFLDAVSVMRRFKNPQELHNLLRTLDLDNDGRVSLEEMVAFIETQKTKAESDKEAPNETSIDPNATSKI